MMRDVCAGGRRFSTHGHPWGADLLSTTAAYISGKASGCYYDSGVFFQQLTNAADTLSFRERVLDIRPQSPDLTGGPSPAFSRVVWRGKAVAGFQRPSSESEFVLWIAPRGALSVLTRGWQKDFRTDRQQKKTKK